MEYLLMIEEHFPRMRLLLLSVTVLTMVGCTQDTEPASSAGTASIDRRSYRLGGIGAFAEMVGAGVKRLALSAPMDPVEMDALIEDATRIAADNGAEVYRENDFLVTDLFPAALTEGKHVLLIYRGTTKQEYLDLKARKSQLVGAGEYVGQSRVAVARRFGDLLSYSDHKIDALLAGRDSTD
jgi:hypothetical protein